MNMKKVCCLVTVTAMLFFGFPAIPFAKVDQVPQLSQEELEFVFQHSGSTWNEKLNFLKYLDEQEMEKTEGKYGHVVGGAVVGAVLGGVGAWYSGGNVWYGAASGALGGAYGGLLSGISGLGLAGRTLTTAGLGTGGGFATYVGCTSACHSVRPQGGH